MLFLKSVYSLCRRAVSSFFDSAKSTAKALVVGVGVGSGALVVDSATNAAYADTAATISSAFTSANGNVQLAASGIITLVAIVTGIGLIVALMRR